MVDGSVPAPAESRPGHAQRLRCVADQTAGQLIGGAFGPRFPFPDKNIGFWGNRDLTLPGRFDERDSANRSSVLRWARRMALD